MTTPMHPNCNLNPDDNSGKIDSKVYINMIGSLLYLIASRPYFYLVYACVQDSNQILVNQT